MANRNSDSLCSNKTSPYLSIVLVLVYLDFLSSCREVQSCHCRARERVARVSCFAWFAQGVSIFQMSTCRRQAPSSYFHTATYFGVARWPSARVSVARPISYASSPSACRSSVDNSARRRSEEHTSELQSHVNLVC